LRRGFVTWAWDGKRGVDSMGGREGETVLKKIKKEKWHFSGEGILFLAQIR